MKDDILVLKDELDELTGKDWIISKKLYATSIAFGCFLDPSHSYYTEKISLVHKIDTDNYFDWLKSQARKVYALYTDEKEVNAGNWYQVKFVTGEEICLGCDDFEISDGGIYYFLEEKPDGFNPRTCVFSCPVVNTLWVRKVDPPGDPIELFKEHFK